MKVKSLVFLFFTFLAFTGLQAQDSSSEKDSVDCVRELSMYATSAKAKQYDSALKSYNKIVDNCKPDLNAAVYQYGYIMFHQYMKDAKNDQEKKKYAKKLIENNKKFFKYYPKKFPGNYYTKTAMLKVDNEIGSKEDQYNALDEAWKKDKENFNDPKALYAYFSLLIDLQDEGKKSLEEAFQKYDELKQKIETEEAMHAKEEEGLRKKKEEGQELTKAEERALHNDEIYLRNYLWGKQSMEAKLGSRADCDNLVPMYEEQFADHKEDANWLKLAGKRLSEKKCYSGQIFMDITKALHEIEPSAKSAKYLAQLAYKKGDVNKAIDYFKQSIELEDNKLDKARVYYGLANIYRDRGSYSQARTYYLKAVKANPSFGDAYLRIARMYAKSVNDCGDTEFEKRSIYWLAADEAKRAGRVDPSLKASVNKAVEAYTSRAPSKSDIFKEGMQGKSITVNCWIGGTVKVPTL